MKKLWKHCIPPFSNSVYLSWCEMLYFAHSYYKDHVNIGGDDLIETKMMVGSKKLSLSIKQTVSAN
jgi:hypothetical protein